MKYRIKYKDFYICDKYDESCLLKANRPIIQMKFLGLFWITIKKFNKVETITKAKFLASNMFYILTQQ